MFVDGLDGMGWGGGEGQGYGKGERLMDALQWIRWFSLDCHGLDWEELKMDKWLESVEQNLED